MKGIKIVGDFDEWLSEYFKERNVLKKKNIVSRNSLISIGIFFEMISSVLVWDEFYDRLCVIGEIDVENGIYV